MWLLPINTPSHASNHLCQMGTESIQNCTCCKADMARCAMFWQFYCKVMAEWPRKYRTMSRSLCMLHPLKLVIICAKYGKNPFRTVHAPKQTQQDAPCFGSFIAKIGLNDLLYMCQGQRLLHTTYHLILVIICAQRERIHPVLYVLYSGHYRMSHILTVLLQNHGCVIMCDTPSHLCLIWKESIQNCRRYRVDTVSGKDRRMDRWCNQYTT